MERTQLPIDKLKEEVKSNEQRVLRNAKTAVGFLSNTFCELKNERII